MAPKPEKGTVAIQSLLEANDSVLGQLRRRSAAIQSIQENLKTILPPPLDNHFTLANISKDAVIVHTDSSAWAARLRFLVPDILECIQRLGDEDPPKSVRIKVVPPPGQPTKSRRTIKLSEKNAQQIKKAANTIKDPSLRAALTRLSKRR